MHSVLAAAERLQCGVGGGARVLVTGAGGFIASHVCSLLCQLGYRVRGTVRSIADSGRVEHLRNMGGQFAVELVQADLTDDQGWDAAVLGCEFVMHCASPFWRNPALGDDFFLPPAIEGTKRVLAACARARVKRVVVTSSVAAAYFGRSAEQVRAHGPFSEADWTDLDGPGTGPYQRSKTLAERASWQFVSSLSAEQRFELVTILPSAVLGPLLSANRCESRAWVESAFTDKSKPVPFIELGWVHVHDVALAHVRAIQEKQAAGHRVLLSAESLNYQTIQQWLSEEFTKHGYQFSTVKAQPDGGPFSIRRAVDNSVSRRLLGVQYRSVREAALDMASSLIKLGVIPSPKKQ